MKPAQTLRNMLQWSHDHEIDFKNSKIIDRATYRHGATLESWHTALTCQMLSC